MNKRQKQVQKQFLDNETQTLDELKKVYNQALESINKNIEDLMARADADTATVVYQLEYQKALKTQINGILDDLNSKQFTTVADYLNQSYEDGFIGTMYDLHGQGVPLLLPIDQEQVVQAVQLDSKISDGLYTAMGENVSKLKKDISSQVSRGIAIGMSYQQVAQQISMRMVGTKYKTGGALARSMTIARTEGHRIQCQAGMDALHKAKDKGADVVKQWDSTLDGRTRESHRAVDREIKELNEKFSNGLMFPGDPDGAAEEVCNCRCALLQRARWALGNSFTKKDGFTGELREFATPKDYDEFKKWYFSDNNVSYMNYIETLEKRHKTKDFAKLLKSMNDIEYKQFKILEAKSPLFNSVTEKVMVEYSKNEAREMVWKNWDEYREKFVKHAVKISDVDLNNDFMYDTVDLSILPTETQTKVFQTIESLEEKFYSPLTKVVTMDKQETAMTTAFGTTTHQWGTASCEIRINPVKIKKTDRIYELSQKRYAVQFEEGREVEYVIAHEYGHSILNIGERLPTKSQNFVDADYTNVTKARKEIELIQKKYSDALDLATKEYDSIRKPIEEKMLFGTGEITEDDRNVILAAKKKVDDIMISKYANTNIDEFTAEAFADAEMGINPNVYSIEVYNVIKKYFGKR